ncbi:MAG: ATP-binding protein [Fimbriimonas sp.]
MKAQTPSDSVTLLGLQGAESFLGNIQAGFIEFDLRTGHFTYLSPRFAEALGYSLAEMARMAPDELAKLFPRGKTSVETTLLSYETLGDDHVTSEDWEVHHRDGRPLFFTLSLRVTARDGKGQPQRVGGIAMNITATMRSNKMLGEIVTQTGPGRGQQSRLEHQARLLGETLDTDYVIVALLSEDKNTANTVLVLADGQIQENMSYTLPGTPCGSVIAGELCCFPRGVTIEFPEDDLLVEMEAESYLGVKIFDRNGQNIGHVAVLDRKPMPDLLYRRAIISLIAERISEELSFSKALAEKQEAEYQLSEVLQSLVEGVALIDTNGQPKWANHRADEILGFDMREFPCLKDGRCVWGLVDEQEVPLDNSESPVVKTLATRAPVRKIVGRRRPDGTVQWLQVYVRPHRRDASGNFDLLLGTFTDITEEKHKADKAREFSDLLEQTVAERTKELRSSTSDLETLCYSVSHDLGGPLRAIDANCHFIDDELGEHATDELKGYLATVRRSAKKMGQLIDQLLAFSRLSQSKVSTGPVDLSAVATAYWTKVEAASPNRHVSWKVKPGMVSAGDPLLIPLAVENLLDNAWKYTARTENAALEMGFDEAAGAFFIRDNGVGFDANFVHKLFTPFQRLHNETEFSGIGVGLSIVRRIIERHGGKVWLEGTLGGGATAFFTLPSP